MKRVGRGVRRIATGLGIAALAVLVLWVWLVPPIVERMIIAQFEAFGLPKPTFRVHGLSLSDLQITNLAVGEEGRLRIGAVGVGYGISQLLLKRIDSIEIIGLEAEIRRKDGAWDLGPLADLRVPAGSEAPFRRIALRASTLVLDLDGRRLRIPFDGSVENAGQDALAMDLVAGVEGVALRIAGTVNTRSQDFRLAMTGEVPDLTALLAAAPPPAAVPGRAWGGLVVKADLSRDKGVLSLDATAQGAGWRLSRFEARETGLEDWLRGKADRADIRVHWDAEAEKPWLLLTATPLGRWMDGEALAKAELSADGALELRRAKAGSATGWTWSATVPAARATLAPSDLAVLAAGAALEGARADLRLAATADADGLRVEVLAGSLASVVVVSAQHGGARFALARGEKPGFELIVGERPVVASVSLGGAKADWKVEGPDLHLALRRGRAELPNGAVADGAAATARLALEVRPDKVTATLASLSRLSLDSLTLPALGLVRALKEPLLNAELGDKPATVSVSPGASPVQWSVALPEARVTLAACSLSFPSAAGAVDGLAGAFVFRADADQTQAALKVLPGSWIGIQSAVATAGDEAMRVGAARFGFAGRAGQPVLAAALEGGRLLSANGALAAEAAGPVTASAGEEVAATLGTIRSAIEGAWGEKGGAFTASIEIGGIEAGLNRKFGDTLVAASVPEAALLLKARRDFPAGPGSVAPLSIEFVLGTPKDGKGASVVAARAEAAGRVEARGTLALGGALAPAIDARVSLADASVRHKEAGLVLASITADVPLTWNVTAPPEAGTFAVKSVELKGSALPAISGTLGVADTRADFTMDWPVLPGAGLRVEGSAAAGARGPSARAYVSLPLFQIKDEEAVGRLVPQLKGVLVSGSFALDGYVGASPAGMVPNIALTVLDGTVKSKAWEAEAEGVYATVRINSLQPVLTPRKELQVALVRHAKMGKLEVNDGFVAFRIEPKEAAGRPPTGWTAWVQRGEWGWAGGRLYVEDFRFDPDAAEHTVTVNARDLKLRDLLALIPNENATGVGSLDGRLTVTVGTWPDLRFGDGQLRTAPGQTGWFRIKNTEILGDVLDSTDAKFLTDNLYVEIKNRLVGAFKDFEYDEINVVFTRDGQAFVTRVNTKGRARTGVRQEFGGVTLNFLDFDKVLRDVILVSRKVLGD